MPKRTSHPAGTPSWIDLATTDVEAAKAFYAELLGWSYSEMPTPMGGMYTMASGDGAIAAGMMPMMPQMMAAGHPSMWTTYITVDDIDATCEMVTKIGGQVVTPTMDVMGSGRMAVIRDTAGAVVALWQPMSHIGCELVSAPGGYTWAELAVRDIPAAKKFYSELFGWTFEDGPNTDMSGNPYINIMLNGTSVAGIMQIDESWGEVPPFWGVYVGVENIDAALEATPKLGGKIVMPIIEIPVGRFAGILDPTGAMITLIQMNEWPAN